VVLLGVSWLLLAVTLVVTQLAPRWQDCYAGDRMSPSEAIAFLCLLVTVFALTGLLSWLLAGSLRPVRPLLSTGGLWLLTVGALAATYLVFSHHSASCFYE
jgi:hypothetical protein